MKKFLTFFSFLITIAVSAQLKYPDTKKIAFSEEYFGTTKVPDPYRWLEDDNSAETKAWVQEENKVTFTYLNTIPDRDKIRTRLEQLWNYPKYSSPFRKAGYYYFFKNDGLQNQSVLYRQKGMKGNPEEFINPNTMSKEGIAAISSISFSKSGKYTSYSVAKAGSDWHQGIIFETAMKKALPDTINWIKFGSFAWKGDDGFYYSGYDPQKADSVLTKQNQYDKIFYHKLGTRQKDDILVYRDNEHPLRYCNINLTEDQRFLILYISEGTSGTALWYIDLNDKHQKKFSELVRDFDTQSGVIDNVGGSLLCRTNYDAPNYRIVLIKPNEIKDPNESPKAPDRKKWKIIIPEKDMALQGVSTCGGYLFLDYLKDASTKVFQYTYDGKLVREISLPGIGTAGGFDGEKTDKDLFYTFSSFNKPPSIYDYTIATGQSALFRKTETKINTDEMITDEVFFPSKDGTKVPMFLTYKKGMVKDGNNPVLVYGYGGFNIPTTPSFSISNAFFIEQGGIYASVCMRGGSEYGEKWHQAGMLDKKQNVFDDFMGAIDYLVKEKYTNNNRVAIRGGSNGGLLVGAVMTQRPDICKVAIPQVGVMDMLRFHKFTVGWGWMVEYGNPDSANAFPYIYKYSPYHNLNKGVHYPATLVTTGDHDDRVVPAHSFKFAARLQDYNAGDNPALIRIETNAGHGAGKPTSKQINEAADIFSFIMYHLGMKFKE